ncbi:thioredoxin [bacterium]|nr:thioredoxin [bacterium]
MAAESEHVIEITDLNIKKEVMESEIPVIVDCWAPWCGPCLMVAPTIAEIAQEFQGTLKVGKLDVDQNQDTAMKFGIRSIPTILIFNKGEYVDQIIGAASKKAILKHLNKAINLPESA